MYMCGPNLFPKLNLNNRMLSNTLKGMSMTSSSLTLAQRTILSTLVVLLSIDFGCISSELTNTWRDPSFKDPPMTNILVIAVKKNAVNRRIWEDGLVAELNTHNVASTPSYRLFPNAIPDTQQVGAAVREKNYDGVLVVRRLPTETTTYDRPGYISSVPVTRFDRQNKSYYTIYKEVNEPGYADTLKTVRHEINLWSTKEGGQLIWAGTGEMLDPGSREAVRNEITGLIVPELTRQGIIPAK
jgi:hypothetical protein